MPRILLQKAKLIQPGSHSGSPETDILIEDGIIRSLGTPVSKDYDYLVSSPNLYVSAGFTDLRTHFTAPGTEHISSLEELAATALQGGFTSLCLWGNKELTHNNREQVDYLASRSGKQGVHWHVMGALTHDHKGKTLNEWHEMFLAGAAGFCNSSTGAESLPMLSIAMRYMKDFSGRLFLQCFHDPLQSNHLMYETPDALQKGIKGIPLYAETAPLAAFLQLISYEKQQVHLSALSTEEAVNMLQTNRREEVTCDVPVMSLFFAQEDAPMSEPEWKVFPPLPDKHMQHGLLQAVAAGKVSALSSMHTPVMPEEKQVEWQLATAGANTLKYAFSLANTALGKHMHTEAIAALFTDGPSRILGKPGAPIAEGMPANLCAFDPDAHTTVFTGSALERDAKGKILACVSGTHFHLHND